MKEEWKEIDIPNMTGTYEVSNLGNVRRTRIYRKLGGVEYEVNKIYKMTPFDNGHGYKVVGLGIREEGKVKRKNYYVHRLVAKAFIPNPLNKPEVNHKDYDRSNNSVSNLEWCTDKENTSYSACHMANTRKEISGIRHRNGKYEVEISHHSKLHYVGRFWDYEDALEARNNKVKELKGNG